MKPSTSNLLCHIRCLLIDPTTPFTQRKPAHGIAGERIDHFLVHEMGFADEVQPLRARLFNQYGTLRVYRSNMKWIWMPIWICTISPSKNCLHLTPNSTSSPALPQRKAIFTASAKHAIRVSQQLGVQNHFERIIDIYDQYPRGNPELDAFHNPTIDEQPQHCSMVDDNPNRNPPALSVWGVMGASA